LFRVYFGDETVWWRCMRCDMVFSFHEYRYEDGSLTRIAVWRREGAVPCSRGCGTKEPEA
jgi:hypothetical protein